MQLAGVTGAFGIWAAHLVVTLGQGRIGAAQIDAQAVVAALLLTAALMSSGFIIAARGPVWHPAAGGAVNGTSIGLVHYGAIYALAVPGVVEWKLPLVAASVGLGAGFGSAAFTANRKLDTAELCARRGCHPAGMTAANLFDASARGDSERRPPSSPRVRHGFETGARAPPARSRPRTVDLWRCTDLSEVLGAAEEQSHLQNALLQSTRSGTPRAATCCSSYGPEPRCCKTATRHSPRYISCAISVCASRSTTSVPASPR